MFKTESERTYLNRDVKTTWTSKIKRRLHIGSEREIATWICKDVHRSDRSVKEFWQLNFSKVKETF